LDRDAGSAKLAVMALTLRPTDLEKSPVYQHLKDYCVYDDGKEIGRIYEQRAPSRPELAWYWSITVMGAHRYGNANGHGPTLEDAKAQFLATWAPFRAARDSDSR
jgi:hypothetical protein